MSTLPLRRLDALLEGLGARDPVPPLDVPGIGTDSRTLRPGEVFLACAGVAGHGLDHLPAARAAGAAAVVWEPDARHTTAPEGLPAVALPGLAGLVGEIGARFHGRPAEDLRVVGITGTDGKSSCSHFLAQALARAGVRCGIIGTLGYGISPDALEPASHTTPDALRVQGLLAAFRGAGCGAVSMEVSSHALDQGRVAGVRFTGAVLTNLGRDHLDYHGDQEAYGAAKARLFRTPEPAWQVLNHDDPFGRRLLARGQGRALAYGLQRPAAGAPEGVWGERRSAAADGMELRVHTPWGSRPLRLPLLGAFNASNALAVLAALLLMDVPLDEAVAGLEALRPVPGRMERFGRPGLTPMVVVDYAHTPQALEQALAALRAHCTGRLWCVFGCGGDRDRGKRPLMAAAAEAGADQVVVTDDNPRSEDPARIRADILAGFAAPERVRVEPDRGRAIAGAFAAAAPGDVILVAGKGHEEWQQVGDRRLEWSDRAEARRLVGAAAGRGVA